MTDPAQPHPDLSKSGLPGPPSPPGPPPGFSPAPQRVSNDHRRAVLAQAIQRWVVSGARVQSQGDYDAVLVTGSKPNHALHGVISLLTCGLWLIGWAIFAAVQKESRVMLTVDDYGNVLDQKIGG